LIRNRASTRIGENVKTAFVAKEQEEMAGRRPKNGTTLGFEKTLGQAADKMRRNLKRLGFDV